MRALIALFAAAMITTAVADDQTSKYDRGKSSMQSREKSFDKLDKNHDGQLSRTEAQKDENLTAQFASVDQDADGFVTQMEYSAAVGDSGSQSQQREQDQ
jgi:Ca2+-binding EF-hand superfamily protein